jgi:hypothetical protein
VRPRAEGVRPARHQQLRPGPAQPPRALVHPAGRNLLVELDHHKKVAAYHAILTEWAVAIAGNRNDWT